MAHNYQIMTELHKNPKTSQTAETRHELYRVLPAVFCRKISAGKYFFKLGEHEYEITNHGYYAPDRCVWWEAVNLKTNEADFHETAKKYLIRTMIRELS
jgi:hypothetical protein